MQCYCQDQQGCLLPGRFNTFYFLKISMEMRQNFIQTKQKKGTQQKTDYRRYNFDKAFTLTHVHRRYQQAPYTCCYHHTSSEAQHTVHHIFVGLIKEEN